MKTFIKVFWIFTFLVQMTVLDASARQGPYDEGVFKGRIAFSSDGNYNDEDDWGAFPVAIAILDAFGVKDKLVHADFNNILSKNDPRFYKEMTDSVLGSAERYNLSSNILFDCQRDLEGAINSITNAINESSEDNPLYFILAGPMEVPYRGIERSDPKKRKFVYCISHSGWNDGYTKEEDKFFIPHTKRDVIPSGIHWIQIRDGNRHMAHPGGPGKKSTPEEWSKYEWLREASDPNLRWIFTRLEAEWRADISDACMTYFLLTGDEDADLSKLKRLLVEKQIPEPIRRRNRIRIEAENFHTLENFEVEFNKDRDASKRISVKLAKSEEGKIFTEFDDLYTADSGLFNVKVRYFDENKGKSELAFFVNGKQHGDSWRASKNHDNYAIHTIHGIPIQQKDQLLVTVNSDHGEKVKLDYVELVYQSPGTAADSGN